MGGSVKYNLGARRRLHSTSEILVGFVFSNRPRFRHFKGKFPDFVMNKNNTYLSQYDESFLCLRSAELVINLQYHQVTKVSICIMTIYFQNAIKEVSFRVK